MTRVQALGPLQWGKEKTDHTVLSSDLHMRAMALAFPSSHPLHTHAHMCTHARACARTHTQFKKVMGGRLGVIFIVWGMEGEPYPVSGSNVTILSSVEDTADRRPPGASLVPHCLLV